MRWPFVESSGEWNYASIYYGERRPAPPPGTTDIGDARHSLADALRDVAALAGEEEDLLDTTLLAISRSVLVDMRITQTRKAVAELADLVGTSVDEAFAERLVTRARETLSGAALVGALRAIGWTLTPPRPGRRYRAAISDLARAEARRGQLVSGYSSLIADDAHAYLSLVEAIHVSDDNPSRSRVLAVRDRWARGGILLLAAAAATALTEPWNPFVQHRLGAECVEHERTFSLDPQARAIVHTMAEELTNRWQATTERWQRETERAGDDIAAYFFTRGSAPAPPKRSDLGPYAQQLCAEEAEWTRDL